MKKLFTLLTIFSFGLLTLKGQPVPSGFETWTSQYGEPQSPVGWATLNILGLSGNPTSVFKATAAGDFNGGTAACKITTVKLTNPPSGWPLKDTLGLAITGSLNLSNFTFNQGFTYSQRPNTLDFYAKYAPNGADTAYAVVYFQKRNGSVVDTIGAAYYYIPNAVSNFTLYQVPIIYNPAFVGINPDTAVVAFFSSGEIKPQVGSALYVDDVSFNGVSGRNDISFEKDLTSVFPNPANDEMSFNLNSLQSGKINIFTISGKKVASLNVIDQSQKINTSGYAEGLYLFHVEDEDGKIIERGRFNIVH